MNKFEVWKEYEKIAMHFNTLLIQLRIRALGSLTVIVTILSFVTKSIKPEMHSKILGSSLIILSIIWVAVYIIDMFYYNKLLIGAVKAITDLEEGEKNNIEFSITVKKIVEGKIVNITPINIFYGIIFLLLLFGGIILICL